MITKCSNCRQEIPIKATYCATQESQLKLEVEFHRVPYNQTFDLRLQNDIFRSSRLCRAPISVKVKMALSLELSGIL